jgi:hypothetical protein
MRIFAAATVFVLACLSTIVHADNGVLRHDPFQKVFAANDVEAGVSKMLNGELTLKAVLYDAQRPLANISGMIVNLGDPVGDYHLLAISPNSVTLTRNGREKTLYLTTAEQSLSAQR